MMTAIDILEMEHEIHMDKIDHAKMYWANPFDPKLPELRKQIYIKTKTVETAKCLIKPQIDNRTKLEKIYREINR